MTKESKKTKKSNVGYISAFGRILTETEAIRHRENETKKTEAIKQKKEKVEARKLVIATKKLDAETMRQKKRDERAKKARIKEKTKTMKAAEVIGRKRKRKKMKLVKKMKRTFQPKRVYRKKLRTSLDQKNTQKILMNPTLKIEGNKARNPTLSMKKYVYPTDEFNVDFRSELQLIVHINHQMKNVSNVEEL